MAGSDANKLLQSSARGISYIMVAIAVQRLLTFSLNTALLRHVSAEVIGFASNDMELMLATILFLARESCQLVALRASLDVLKTGSGIERQRFANIAWLPVPIGLLLTLTAAGVYRWLHPTSVGLDERAVEKVAGFYIYCTAALVETCVAPFVIYAQSMMLYGGRAATDMFAMVFKCLTIFACVAVLGYRELGFALGQLTYALAITTGFVVSVLRGSQTRFIDLLPGYVPSPSPRSSMVENLRNQFGPHESSMLLAFQGQSIVKHLLTESDRITNVIAGNDVAKGVYVAVANYGSLAARLIFQPLEESLRGLVSKLVRVHRDADDVADHKHGESTGRHQNGAVVDDQHSATVAADLKLASTVFFGVLRLVIIVGLIFAVFGPAYSQIAETMLLGSKAKSQYPGFAESLSAYCFYVFFLALNGVTEAFATGAADQKRISQSNLHMGLAFVSYVAVAAVLMPRYGSVGLIAANCVNMALRSVSSLSYIFRLLKQRGQPANFTDALPKTQTLVAFAGSNIILFAVRPMFDTSSVKGSAGFVAVGAVCGLLVLVVLYIFEWKQGLLQTWSTLKGRPAAPAAAAAAAPTDAVQSRTVPAASSAAVKNDASTAADDGPRRRSPRRKAS